MSPSEGVGGWSCSPASRSWSRCSGSTCSPRACATGSTLSTRRDDDLEPPSRSSQLEAEDPPQDHDHREEGEERAEEEQRALPPQGWLQLLGQELPIDVPDLHPVDRHHQSR